MVKYKTVAAPVVLTVETISTASIFVTGIFIRSGRQIVNLYEGDGTTLIATIISPISGFPNFQPPSFDFTVPFLAPRGLVVENVLAGATLTTTVFYNQDGA